MNGPLRQPPHWTHRTIQPKSCPDRIVQDIPRREPRVAIAFSIQQIGSDGKDKIRRGEFWRRSGHNSTCIMRDQPYHHTPDLRILHPESDLHVWGHDHAGAYRQLPLREPEHAYVLLITPVGPALWSHNVLLFGSAASVWGYNRFGDSLVAVSRIVPGSALCRRLRQRRGRRRG